MTSAEEFHNLFESLSLTNAEFQKQAPQPFQNPDTILYLVKKHRADAQRQFPAFPDYLVRLCAAALAILCLRSVDMFMRERALMLWIIEGEKYFTFSGG